MGTWEIIAAVVVPILGIGIAFLGTKWQRVKKVVSLIDDALEDDKLTVEELRAIISAITHG